MADQGIKHAIAAGTIRVMVFGQLADITGAPAILLENIADTDSLVNNLNQLYPGLRRMKYIIAVDRKMVSGNAKIGSQSEVALLPPFSGG
jgi:molybdopterin converting factor small subunit